MNKGSEKSTGRLAEFEALEQTYRAQGDWNKLARLYEEAATQITDQRISMQRFLQAGVLYRDKLKLNSKAVECFDHGTSLLKKEVSATDDKLKKSDLLCELAKIHLEVIEDREKAIQTYVEAFELDPQKTHLMVVLGDLYADKEGWQDIVSRFGIEAKGAQSKVVKAKYLEEIAGIYNSILNDGEKAIGVYRNLLAEDPSNRKAQEALETLLIKQRRWKDLTALYIDMKASASDHDELTSILSKLGLIYKDKLCEPLEAAKAYRDILNLDPENFRIRTKLEELGKDQQTWKNSLANMESQVTLSHDRFERAQILIRQSIIAKEYLDQKEMAQEKAAEALSLDPENPQILEYLTQLWSESNAWERIAQSFELAADKTQDPRYRIELYRKLSHLSLEKLKDPMRAIANLEAIIQISPQDQESQERLIPLYEGQRMWSALEKILETCALASTPPRQQELLFKLAKVREQNLNNVENAILVYEKILTINPKELNALSSLESLYTLKRRWADLLNLFAQKADLLKEPNEKAELFLKQAQIAQEKIGDLKKASLFYEQLLPLSKEPDKVVERLENIYSNEKMWKNLSLLYQGLLRNGDITLKDKISYNLKLAEVQGEKLGSIKDAQINLALVLKDDPRNLSALKALEKIAEEQKDWNGLITILDHEFKVFSDPKDQVSSALKIADLFLHKQNNEDKAESYFRKVLELDETNQGALSFLSELYRRRDRKEDLLHILERQIKISADPTSLSSLNYEMGQLLESTMEGRLQAILYYERALEHDPTFTSARQALTSLYTRYEHWNKLTKVCMEELDQTKDRMHGALVAAKVARLFFGQLNEPKRAIGFFQKSLELNSSDVEVIKDFVQVLEKQKLFEEALPLYENLVQLLDDLKEKTESCIRAAEIELNTKKNYVAAINWFERAISFNPENIHALEQLATLYESTENWNGLLTAYERLLLKAKGHGAAKLHYQVGELYEHKRGDVDRALVAYQIAREKDPNFLSPLSAMRRLLRSEENWGEYLKATLSEATFRDTPKEKAELLIEVAILWKDKFLQIDKSIFTFQEILKFDPLNTIALTNLSSLYFDRGNWKESHIATSRALETTNDPQERTRLLERLGIIELQKMNEHEAAIKTFREMVSLNPKQLHPVALLAQAYKASQDWKGLLSTLQLQLELEQNRQSKIGLLFQIADLWKGPLGSNENAIETYRAILSKDPLNLNAISALGETVKDQKQWFSIIEKWTSKVQEPVAPKEYVDVVLSIANISVQRFQARERAIALLAHTNEKLGDQAPVLDALISFYEKHSEPLALADTTFRRSKLLSDPREKATALLQVANLWAETLENPRQAIQVLTEAKRSCPNQTEITDRLITLFLLMKDFKEANALIGETLLNQPLTTARGLNLALKKASILKEHLHSQEEALSVYEEILKVYPRHRIALRAIISIYEDKEDWPSLAKALYEFASIARGTESTKIHAKLAHLYEEKLQNLDQAIHQYNIILRSNTQDVQALCALERLYERKGDFSNILNILLLKSSTTQSADELGTLYRRAGEIYVDQLKDVPRGIDLFERSLDQIPNQKDLLHLLAQHYRILERYADLASVLKKYARLCESEDSNFQEAIKIYGEAADLFFHKLNNPIFALDVLNDLLRLSPHHKGALTKVASIFEQQENYQGLAQTLLSLADTASTNDEKLQLLKSVGVLQVKRLGQESGAIETYKRILTIDPSNKEALKNLKKIFELNEKWKDYSEILKDIIKNISSKEATLILKELAHIEMDHLNQVFAAIKTFEILFSIEPGNEEVTSKLLNLYERNGNFQKLAELLEKELGKNIEPRRSDFILKQLGVLYDDRLHQPDRSIACFEKFLKRTQKDHEVLSRLETLYRKTGKVDDADRILETKATLMPFGEERSILLLSLANRYWANLRRDENAIRCYHLLAQDPKERRKALVEIANIYEENGAATELLKVLHSLVDETSKPSEKFPILLKIGSLEQVKAKNLEASEKAFLCAKELHPHHPEVISALFNFYKDTQSYKKAQELLKAEIESTKDVSQRSRMLKDLADLWRGPLGKPSEAIPFYEDLVRLSPHEVTAVSVLADLYYENKKWHEAAPLFDRLAKITSSKKDPKKAARMFFKMGIVYRRLGLTEDAILYFNQSLSFDPGFLDSLRCLADLYYELNQWDNALKTLKEVISLGRAEDQTFVDQYYFRLLQTLVRLGSNDEALHVYEEAKKQLSQHLGSLKLAADLYVARKDWESAQATYTQILERTKTNIDRQLALYSLAEIALNQIKNIETARGYLTQLFREDPNHKAGLGLYLRICKQQREWPDAITVLKQLSHLETNPEKLSATYLELGQIHDQETGDLKKAKDYYLKSIEVGLGETAAMDALKAFCHSEKDWRELATLYEKTAQKLQSKGKLRSAANFHMARGFLFLNQVKDHSSGLNALQEAVSLDPTSESALIQLGRVLMNLKGREDESKVIFEKLISLYPEKPVVLREVGNFFEKSQNLEHVLVLRSCLVGIGAQNEYEDRFIKEHQQAPLTKLKKPFDFDQFDDILPPEARSSWARFFLELGESLIPFLTTGQRSSALLSATEIIPEHTSQALNHFSKQLGLDRSKISTYYSTMIKDISVELIYPPAIGVGPGLFKLDSMVQQYLLAYHLTRIRLGYRLLSRLPNEAAEELLDAISALGQNRSPRKEGSQSILETLRKSFSKRELKFIFDHFGTSSQTGHDSVSTQKLLSALETTSLRIAYLLCDDISSSLKGANYLGPEKTRELLLFFTSNQYLDWRSKHLG